MSETAIQDHYEERVAVCYGCGRLNDDGLHIRSYWDGEKAACHFQPRPEHLAFPGFVYGGLIASLVDCHGVGTAAAAAYAESGRPQGSEPRLRFVTASLRVDFRRPTPMGPELRLVAEEVGVDGRKRTIRVEVFAGETLTARGEVIAYQIDDTWLDAAG